MTCCRRLSWSNAMQSGGSLRNRKEIERYKHMLEDYKILLYLDCKQGIKSWVPIGIVAVEGIKWFV